MEKILTSWLYDSISYFSRERSANSIYHLLAGSDKNFKAEHQFFNLTCLFTMGGFSFFIIINTIFEIDFTLTLIKLSVVFTSTILYYYSRVKMKFILDFCSILFNYFIQPVIYWSIKWRCYRRYRANLHFYTCTHVVYYERKPANCSFDYMDIEHFYIVCHGILPA